MDDDYKEIVNEEANICSRLEESKFHEEEEENIKNQNFNNNVNDLISHFITVYYTENATEDDVIDALLLFYDADRSTYSYSSSVEQFLDILKTFMDYQPDSKMFKAFMDCLYSMCDISFPDFILPLIQNNDLIQALISNLHLFPSTSSSILKLLKMIMIESDECASEIMKKMGLDFLLELFDLSHDQSKLLQKDASALIYNFLKTDFDKREYETLGSWFLDVFKSHLEEFSQDSLEYLMDSIPLFSKIYGPNKWSEIVEKSHLVEWMWDYFNHDSLILTTYQLLYVLSNVIKFSNSKGTFPIDFDLLGNLISSEDNKTKIAAYNFLRKTFTTSKTIHDFIYTENFLHLFFNDINEAPFDVKKSAIRLLYCLLYEANGIDALEIGNYGVFELLIPHIELYPFRYQKKIIHIFERILFWGQRRGDQNQFIDQLNACDGFNQLHSLLEQPTINKRLKYAIDRIMTEYFDNDNEEDDNEHIVSYIDDEENYEYEEYEDSYSSDSSD